MITPGFAHTGSQLLDLVKRYNSLFSFFYPETLKNLYIINAPWAFSVAWSPLTSQK